MSQQQTPSPELLRDFRRAVRAKIERDLALEDEHGGALRAAAMPRLRAGLACARAEGLCTRAWLFGSYAWGQPDERSDIDLLVHGCTDPILTATVIGESCPGDLHVVRWEDAPESLRTRVVADGVELSQPSASPETESASP